MSHDLRVGISILQNLPYPELVERWQLVEQLGYHSLWAADHYSISMNPEGIFFDGWTMLTAMAHETENIRIGLMVTSPTQHNPAMLAKRAMTVDHIANGRLELAIGAGGRASADEETMLGIKSDWTNGERVARFREFVEIVQHLLQNTRTTYEGKYYQLHDTVMSPLPVQQPVPLTLAALGKKSLKIAAQYANTWNTYGKAFSSPEETFDAAKKQMQLLDQYCDEIGRDPSEIRRSFYPFGALPYGVSVQGFLDFVEPYREIGFSEFVITWLPEDMPGLPPHLMMTRETLERIAIDALPELRAQQTMG